MKSQELISIIKKSKDSGKKVFLAVEGGGLRAVISGAFLYQIERLGLRVEIDGVAGTSAGAVNLCYFLGGQASQILPLYKRMASPHFIQPTQWPNLMNLDYLFEDQIPHHFPLNWENLRKQKIDFHISMTHTETGKGHFSLAQELQSDDDLKRVVKASASAPLLTSHQEKLWGQSFNDGQVNDAIPIRPFIDHKDSIIIALLTRPSGYQKNKSFMSSMMQKIGLRNYSQEYKNSFSNLEVKYNKTLERIYSQEEPQIIPLCIENGDYMVSKMTKNPDEIQKGFDQALQRII